MRRLTFARPRLRATLLAGATLAACAGATVPFMASGNAGSTHTNGVFCTKDSSTPGTATFDLTAKDGHIGLPDGSTAYMWGYTTGYSRTTGEVQRGVEGEFQHPGPVLCVRQNDVVTIVLHNTLSSDDVSVVFPGQHGVTANGAPVQPVTSGSLVKSLTAVATRNTAPTTAPNNGGTVTYQFTADHAGTFLYQSGTNPQVQVRMGLFGALIVRPADGSDSLFGAGTGTTFRAESEYLGLLSELDPYLNQRAETNEAKFDANPNATVTPFNLNNYKPRYWLINGRGFPDSIADNFADWLPGQPYGSLAEIQPKSASNPDPSLDRYIGVGTQDYPFHPHGNNAQIVGRDGQPVGVGLGADKFSIPVGPGQTWDALFDWADAEQYDKDSNPIPTVDPQIQNLSIGTFYGGTPYLGVQGPLPPGSSSQNECGEYYIIAHNHALQQITSWGVNMTGPITYTRVNPPGPSCS